MTLNCPFFTNKKLEYTGVAMILTTKEQIDGYRLRVLISGLKLEIMGMRHSRNLVFKTAKAITGKKTRLDCLEALQKLAQ
jgi:hypothetical protein